MPCFDKLLYAEYFETFMVAATCPLALRSCFPELLPTAGHTAQTGLQAWLDCAPHGKRHFVYRRMQGEDPLCRLEMKFQHQKEAFYLRQILLHYPKRSFEDARRHLGKQYSTYEQALLATGRLRMQQKQQKRCKR